MSINKSHVALFSTSFCRTRGSNEDMHTVGKPAIVRAKGMFKLASWAQKILQRAKPRRHKGRDKARRR